MAEDKEKLLEAVMAAFAALPSEPLPAIPLRPKTISEIEEERAAADWSSIAFEVEGFRSQLAQGATMLMVPCSDRSFRIVEMRRRGEYIILDGIDADYNDARIVQHRSQFNVRLVAAQSGSGPVRGAFNSMMEGD